MSLRVYSLIVIHHVVYPDTSGDEERNLLDVYCFFSFYFFLFEFLRLLCLSGSNKDTRA